MEETMGEIIVKVWSKTDMRSAKSKTYIPSGTDFDAIQQMMSDKMNAIEEAIGKGGFFHLDDYQLIAVDDIRRIKVSFNLYSKDDEEEEEE